MRSMHIFRLFSDVNRLALHTQSLRRFMHVKKDSSSSKIQMKTVIVNNQNEESSILNEIDKFNQFCKNLPNRLPGNKILEHFSKFVVLQSNEHTSNYHGMDNKKISEKTRDYVHECSKEIKKVKQKIKNIDVKEGRVSIAILYEVERELNKVMLSSQSSPLNASPIRAQAWRGPGFRLQQQIIYSQVPPENTPHPLEKLLSAIISTW